MTYKIMIVDDQFVSREMFKLYISQCPDYEVVYCVDTAMFADTYVLNTKLGPGYYGHTDAGRFKRPRCC